MWTRAETMKYHSVSYTNRHIYYILCLFVNIQQASNAWILWEPENAENPVSYSYIRTARCRLKQPLYVIRTCGVVRFLTVSTTKPLRCASQSSANNNTLTLIPTCIQRYCMRTNGRHKLWCLCHCSVQSTLQRTFRIQQYVFPEANLNITCTPDKWISEISLCQRICCPRAVISTKPIVLSSQRRANPSRSP